ncbi:ATP synthase-coupling factor 6-like protein [Leptotrombidium deliense]|uniref:ATP synthase-coupling factor 6-like protein n=1 Tax=Leptotrombidium deliense TaxID=299467 RepID=A0A443SDA5_9ACAR|nr:ATP synthase-coupling factor 6-like protein [Leptotrombidium deliense]
MKILSGLAPIIRSRFIVANTVPHCRLFASGATASDSVQKLFVDKIAEYKSKAKSSPDGLVDVSPAVTKALQEEMQRIKRTYGVKDGEETKLTSKFSDEDFKVDPINMNEWK